ncbi:MAG: AraC family transcriptional regulator [Hyphomicrobiales bacterium]|nr:AraC family transcriptional regulator [Hyphomicrobiales bacterium]
MYLESRALELATIAFQQLVSDGSLREKTECQTRTLIRAHAARHYIDNHLDSPLTLRDIALHTGLSISSLQRHFKSAFGTTVVDYLRAKKLANAREAIEKKGVSVSEAAFLAGYTNPSSFATAFKRAFGISPRMVRS